MISQQLSDSDEVLSSKLRLVDLAGSEQIEIGNGQNDLSAERLMEGKTINRSLASLTMVINALAKKEVKTEIAELFCACGRGSTSHILTFVLLCVCMLQ